MLLIDIIADINMSLFACFRAHVEVLLWTETVEAVSLLTTA